MKSKIIAMEGKLTYIRAIEQKDLELVRQWNFSSKINGGFAPSLPINMAEQQSWYEKTTADKTKNKFIIVDKSSDKSIGLISAMRIDHVNKNCEVGWTIGEPSYWGKGYTQDASITFCKFLFEQLGMHMLYGYVLESNKAALKSDLKMGFIETGRLKEFIFKDNRFQDNIIVCLMKENFYEAIKKFGFE